MKYLTICTILTICIAGCVALTSCAQGIYKEKDGEVYIKVNTLFKDIKWGDYQSAVAKFKAITPYGYVETEDGK
ncbi:hypothetical protein LCGC14_1205810 [marine sediment metagenome]|uniref:Uncharacterized protein n=1 Tax=marine sediment metagenome TaxID=412755 RepID=A0A0F9NXS2_9ZZZZ